MICTLYRPARAARLAAAKAHLRRVARIQAAAITRFRNGAAVARALAGGLLVTITAHMSALGADAEMCRRFGSHAGKRVKAAFRARTGRDPVQVWTVRAGRLIQVCAYEPSDPSLAAGLAGYARTAHLVAV
ncbi:hypothetical protein [Nocardia paucivorans]|uniref:hypothetical protein n=1 Tax=Nocardia paucivorans TaxID=114259 RepID=UPI0002F85133|nr:hypothetical protein [Nocardia paucivorans]